MNVPDLREVLATAEVVHDRATLEAAIDRMAGEIAPEYADAAKPPLYITVMHGGLLFAASLAMELGALGIDLDRSNLAAVLVGATDVEVADRGAHRGSALRELLGEAFGDFGGEVAAVELRDGRHDSVDQHPRWGLVDRLRRRYQGDACGEKGFVNPHVISAVAGEPVELVHDAELHPCCRDERKHVLQP